MPQGDAAETVLRSGALFTPGQLQSKRRPRLRLKQGSFFGHDCEVGAACIIQMILSREVNDNHALADLRALEMEFALDMIRFETLKPR